MTEPGPYAVILAARMTSDRLPGKCMLELAPGLRVLPQLIARWRQSDRQPTVIVTTTTDPADDPIAAAASAAGVPCSRGDRLNVVAQMDAAVRRYCPGAGFVARALADNPLVDVALADWRLDILAETGADGLWYGEGGHDHITYAGTTDVWSRAAWDRIAAESSGSQLEHPGAYFWENVTRFSVVPLPPPRREFLAGYRTELDTLFDLELFQAVWAAWRAEWQDPDDAPACVSTLWALKWLAAHPLVAAINAGVRVKTMSKALFNVREKPWLCARCERRMGSVKEGNLQVFCPGCGEAKKFFSSKPKRDMGWVP
jgi:spore coat polysaccharide biosynthesis protein SpsF (cytidylyltransferase family)